MPPYAGPAIATVLGYVCRHWCVCPSRPRAFAHLHGPPQGLSHMLVLLVPGPGQPGSAPSVGEPWPSQAHPKPSRPDPGTCPISCFQTWLRIRVASTAFELQTLGPHPLEIPEWGSGICVSIQI